MILAIAIFGNLTSAIFAARLLILEAGWPSLWKPIHVAVYAIFVFNVANLFICIIGEWLNG